MTRTKITFRCYIISFIWFCQLNLITLEKFSSLKAAEAAYLSSNPNVSYEEILELPYRISDHRISYGEEPPQFGRLWLPESKNNGTVIFVHGGCWINEYGIDHTQAFSTALAVAGYAVWSIEYRRTGDPGGGWPGTFEDVITGINKLSDLDHFGLDMERLVLMGHSAGGHLAVLAGARSELLEVKPALVLGLAAITDVVTYAEGQNSCQEAAAEFMGGTPEERPDAFGEVQPVNFGVNSDTVLLSGAIDQIVPPSQAELSGATVIRHENAGHFDWIHPGTDAFQVILSILARDL